MIVTRTPFRLSLFGGGTDFPLWYLKNGGAVLSFTIDKYCYISTRVLPPFFPHKYRVIYSKMEMTTTLDEIKHPAVREAIRAFYPYDRGLEIHHDGDLPARSGVGSSSAFAVGLIHALRMLAGQTGIKRSELAFQAIQLEQEILKENVGSQDQIACALGGINFITFGSENENWIAKGVNISEERCEELEERMVLVYSGIERMSSQISLGLIQNIFKKESALSRTMDLAKYGYEVLAQNSNLDQFGEMLDESWFIKKATNPLAVNPQLEDLREFALQCGASAIKILGAGGGGFILCWLPSGVRQYFISKFNRGLVVPFKVNYEGSSSIEF